MSNAMDVRPIPEGAASLTISDELRVEANVLIAPHVSINIANIATVSVIPIAKPRPSYWPIMLILMAGYFLNTVSGYSSDPFGRAVSNNLSVMIAIGTCVAAFIYIVWVVQKSSQVDWRLLIGASDGSRNYFTSPDRQTLIKARDVLTEIMNGQHKGASYTINFNTGAIKEVTIAKTDTVVVNSAQTGTVIAASGAARVGTADTILTANNSPGAQLGTGHTATGNAYSVDYSSVLPEVTRIREHYERDPRAADLAARIRALEEEMRAGTPTPQSKERLRSLIETINGVLHLYPALVQFFQHILRMAGG